ncbi:MAG: TlpA family protein disulfide reductase [Bdellovibrionaceae bacterium]|nr:TlpA family protein disulfide reductase [Pseudobdellovibrionaceae bacterium]
MGLGWWKYQEFLMQGSRPPEGTQKLNQMEKKGVPDFTLNTLAGEPIQLSALKDKVVIVSFWATWCEPCVEEFPSLMNLIREFKGDIILLAISADNTLDELKAFIKAFKADDPNIKVMWDKDQKVADLYGTQVLPESYILGYDNTLIRKIAGVDKWDSPQALEYFKDIVDKKDTPQTQENQ